ncbi:preprotein translocase subunit Sec61beta [Candidatus Bathyarchaeota archaeon]|nr:preprotein translocase subunit Sec61beta [Candidatus Bathyarchaeota archaeon]
MSRRRRRKDERRAPMPAQSAGLLRFFEEETEGLKVKPELLIFLVIAFIVVSVLAHLHALGAI